MAAANYTKQNRVLFVKNAILSFPKNLFSPGAVNKDQPDKKSYSCSLILDGDTVLEIENEDKTRKVVTHSSISDQMLKAAFGNLNTKQKNWAFRPNTESVNSKSGDRYAGYEDDNGFYMGPKKGEKDGPPIFRAGGIQITAEQAAKVFYGGCRVSAKLTLATFNGDQSMGLTAFLIAVKFDADGTPFSVQADDSGLDDEADSDTL